MSSTFCIKYALGHVTVEDVTWVFNETFGEELVIKVTELIKDDRYSGKKFKIFFIECDKAKQTKGNVDRLERNITKNAATGDKKGARVKIDSYGHYWQVVFAKEQVPKEQAAFKPSLVDEPEAQTAAKAEEGEIVEANAGKVIEVMIAKDDPICQEAFKDAVRHFSSRS
jgi:hypothetical protein